MKAKDHFSEYIFEESKPRPGEKGYLKPGYHLNEKGKIVDDEGNVYDKKYDIIKEAPSEALLRASRLHPGLTDAELNEFGYVRASQVSIDREKREAQRRKMDQKRHEQSRKQ